MQRSKNDLWVGLFIMLGAVALVFLALQSANLLSLQFHSGYRITAKFDNIGTDVLKALKEKFDAQDQRP